MNQALDEINKDLILKNYDLMKQLKISQIENREKVEKIAKMEKLQNNKEDLDELKSKLSKAEEKIKELELSNKNLNSACFKLHNDNVYLSQQLSSLSQQNLEQAMMLQTTQNHQQANVQTLQEVESQMGIQSEEATGSDENSGDPEDETDENQENDNKTSESDTNKSNPRFNKRKVSTIAMKLKLAKDAPPIPTPETSPKFYAPRFKKQSQQNIKSIMIGGLYRGITRDDVVNYFGRFGSVTDYKEPMMSYNKPEGTKFMFIKYKDYESVEEALASSKHNINGVSVFVKKSFKEM